MLGHRIRQLRDRRRLTQEQLAEALGVNSVTVSRWETGTMTPEPANLQKLADLFGVPAQSLQARVTSPVPLGDMLGAPDTEAAVLAETHTLLWTFSRLDAHDREAVIDYAQRLRLQASSSPDRDDNSESTAPVDTPDEK